MNLQMLLGRITLAAVLIAALRSSDSASFAAAAPFSPAAFSAGEANFHRVLAMLQEGYVDKTRNLDDFYQAATQGLLENLDPAHKDWNQLLTPLQYQSAIDNHSGHLVGVGVIAKFIAEDGIGLILEVLPHSPALAAGLHAGDLVLSVDGQSFKRHPPEDFYQALRGPAGTSVGLSILRDAKVLGFSLHRQALEVETEAAKRLDDGTGYLAISLISERTAEAVQQLLTTLTRDNLRAMIVDLRGCPGGSFHGALATAGLFVAPGTPLASWRDRSGEKTVEVASGGPVLAPMPFSVLIDADTGSGCELLAATLQHYNGATLVGKRSHGKWSMQSLAELPNHFAIKYTVATFTPSGNPDPAVTA